jgi:hypothetical protein
MGKPSFSLRWRKGFDRDLISYHTTPTEFIYEILTGKQVAQFMPIGGPFPTNNEIAEDFISGLRTEHQYWESNLFPNDKDPRSLDWSKWSDPDFQLDLIARFPRSYDCWSFNRRCPYYPLCFRHEGWESPGNLGFAPRSYR